MGSFNEICALSGLIIQPGDAVNVLFLTKNPYNFGARGCYHFDQWFLRTLPISGIYDDYGKAEFKENKITKLIEKVFATDIIEQPFGFNSCHDLPSPKTPNIHQLLEIAREGRLLVKNSFGENDKTLDFNWTEIHDILRKNKLPLMDYKKDSATKGYNAQDVYPGIVILTANFGYSENKKGLEKASKLFKDYDCQIVNQIPPDKGDFGLIIATKGSFNNPERLIDFEYLKEKLSTFPNRRSKRKCLPVLSVMVREDVWSAYLNNDITNDWNKVITVESIYGQLKEAINEPSIEQKIFKNLPKKAKEIDGMEKLNRLNFYKLKMIIHELPCGTSLSKHVEIGFSEPKFLNNKDKDNLLRLCAETLKIENTMASINQSWQIPTFGSQSSNWNLRINLLKDISNIAKNAKRLEKQ